MNFTLSIPGVNAFCTPGDVAVLRTALDAAERFASMGAEAREAAIARAAMEDNIFPMPVA